MSPYPLFIEELVLGKYNLTAFIQGEIFHFYTSFVLSSSILHHNISFTKMLTLTYSYFFATTLFSLVYALPTSDHDFPPRRRQIPSTPTNSTLTHSSLEFYPVSCYTGKPSPPSVVANDCDVLINNVIMRSGQPMQEYTWGYSSSAEKMLPRAGYWHSGRCVIAVANHDLQEIGIFSLMEIGLTAGRIVQECVIDTETTPFGGTSSIGSAEQNFIVYVGGLQTLAIPPMVLEPNGSTLSTNSFTNGLSGNYAGTATQKLKRAVGRFKRGSSASGSSSQPGNAANSVGSIQSSGSISTTLPTVSGISICGSGNASASTTNTSSISSPSVTGSPSATSAGSSGISSGVSVTKACIPASLVSIVVAETSIVSTATSAGRPEMTVVPVYHALSPFDTGFGGGGGGGIFKRDAAPRQDTKSISAISSASSASSRSASTLVPVYNPGNSPPENGLGGGAGFVSGGGVTR